MSRFHPRCVRVLGRALGVAMLCVALNNVASAQLISPACQKTCPNPATNPAGAASCSAEITTCQTKLGMYQAYMLQLGAGATLRQLPALYREILQPHYPGASMNTWRFAFGDRQPANNATTDCGNTYFNNAAYVAKLANGDLNSDQEFRWLAHELWHWRQCNQVGGRDFYATMWFRDLQVAFIQNADLATLHGNMPMEQDAFTNAATVLNNLRTNRDASGKLVRAINAQIVQSGTALGAQVTRFAGTPQGFSAQITGGSQPFDIRWTLRRPNTPTPTVQNGATSFSFVPDVTGDYVLTLRVWQNGSDLVPSERTVRITVQPTLVASNPVQTVDQGRATQIGSVTPSRTVSLAKGTFTVRVVSPSAQGGRGVSGATVSLGTQASAAAVGTRTTDLNGNATFADVTVGNYQVTVSKQLCTTSSSQQTVAAPSSSASVVLSCVTAR